MVWSGSWQHGGRHSGAPEQASFGSGPGLMRWLWHCAKRVHDAGQHGTRHWELVRGNVGGGDCVRLCGTVRLVSGVGTAVWCVTAVCVTAVDVRMKSVLDSETRGRMDGQWMDGQWMDGMVSGREKKD